jgi:hypothetical protein
MVEIFLRSDKSLRSFQLNSAGLPDARFPEPQRLGALTA